MGVARVCKVRPKENITKFLTFASDAKAMGAGDVNVKMEFLINLLIGMYDSVQKGIYHGFYRIAHYRQPEMNFVVEFYDK